MCALQTAEMAHATPQMNVQPEAELQEPHAAEVSVFAAQLFSNVAIQRQTTTHTWNRQPSHHKAQLALTPSARATQPFAESSLTSGL